MLGKLLPIIPPALIAAALCTDSRPLAGALLMAAFWLAGMLLGGLMRD